MRPPRDQPPRGAVAYQAAILGASALVILGFFLVALRGFQAVVGQPGGVSLGLSAMGQVLGAAAPRGPAASDLPGLVGTPTASATATQTATRTTTPTTRPTETATPTPTPNVELYDPNRARTLLAQAQTTFGDESAAFLANVTFATERLNQQRVAPNATFSFDALEGPYSTFNGYRALATPKAGLFSDTVQPVEGGITQVSTTLFQAAFWTGLQIVDRHPHDAWLDRFDAGSTGQRGLDAAVGPTQDLRFQNNTGDWIRIEANVQPGILTVAIYGTDPGWSVNPSVSPPSRQVPALTTPTLQPDPNLPPGQQFTLAPGSEGFDVTIQRTVSKNGQVVDRYGLAEHYRPTAPVISVGPTPTPSPELLPSPTPVGSGPTHLSGLNPGAFVLPDGRIRTPSLVGLSESEAQQVIMAVGLSTTYVNYQGPGDVPASALNSVAVGQVLSQNPQPGQPAPRGTKVYLAVRKA